jgi:polyhydroxyalkanoate synthase subunit PhaC
MVSDKALSASESLPQDNRFDDSAWWRRPISILHQSFLATQQYWHNATSLAPDVSKHHVLAMRYLH